MRKYAKILIYSFFCLSQNGALIQGYLKIGNTNKMKNILDNLIIYGPHNLSTNLYE
jgi:hypothetical protein